MDMEYRDGGYGLVLRNVMRSQDFKIEAKGIYAYLCAHANRDGMCYPSVALMCHDLNMHADRFYRHFNLLVKGGIVRVEKVQKQGRFANNRYFLLYPSLSPYPQNTDMVFMDMDCTDTDFADVNRTSVNITSSSHQKKQEGF